MQRRLALLPTPQTQPAFPLNIRVLRSPAGTFPSSRSSLRPGPCHPYPQLQLSLALDDSSQTPLLSSPNPKFNRLYDIFPWKSPTPPCPKVNARRAPHRSTTVSLLSEWHLHAQDGSFPPQPFIMGHVLWPPSPFQLHRLPGLPLPAVSILHLDDASLPYSFMFLPS